VYYNVIAEITGDNAMEIWTETGTLDDDVTSEDKEDNSGHDEDVITATEASNMVQHLRRFRVINEDVLEG
jgi:hypothetical protein